MEDLIFVKTFSRTSLRESCEAEVRKQAADWIQKHKRIVGRHYIDVVVRHKFFGLVVVTICNIFYSHPLVGED